MKYKHVIFDFDGTLADTISGITYACNEVSKKYNINKVFTDKDVMIFIGKGSKHLFLSAFNLEDLDEHTSKMYDDFMTYYLSCQLDHLNLYENAEKVLKTLQNLNIFLYIYSNKPHDILVECVKKVLPSINFKLVLGNRTEDKPKPDPTFMNEYFKNNNIKKEESIYVGDSIVDLRFAQNLGVDSLILTHGYWNSGDINKEKITYIAKNMEDILTYII